MSSVSIAGDTSGSILLAAPAVAGSSTITLPTTGGIVRTTTTPGTVLQVAYTAFPNTWTGSSLSWADVSGFSAAITPLSTSSRILVQISLGRVTSSPNSIIFRMTRNGTPTLVGSVSGSRMQASFSGFRVINNDHASSQSFTGLDSPASTSALTYQLQFATEGGGAGYINRNVTFPDGGEPYNCVTYSSITLTEIAG